MFSLRIGAMPSWARRATTRFAILGLALSASACASRRGDPRVSGAFGATEAVGASSPAEAAIIGGIAPGPPGGSGASSQTDAPVEFAFASLDDRPMNAASFRGRASILAFIESDEIASQAQAGFLAVMQKTDGDRVNYALVAVEEADRRELVLAFRGFFESKFGVSLRGGMADEETRLGHGPFGDVSRLTVVVLDPSGKIVWRRVGIARAEELRAVLARLR
jgi:hypothetical protein